MLQQYRENNKTGRSGNEGTSPHSCVFLLKPQQSPGFDQANFLFRVGTYKFTTQRESGEEDHTSKAANISPAKVREKPQIYSWN